MPALWPSGWHGPRPKWNYPEGERELRPKEKKHTRAHVHFFFAVFSPHSDTIDDIQLSCHRNFLDFALCLRWSFAQSEKKEQRRRIWWLLKRVLKTSCVGARARASARTILCGHSKKVLVLMFAMRATAEEALITEQMWKKARRRSSRIFAGWSPCIERQAFFTHSQQRPNECFHLCVLEGIKKTNGNASFFHMRGTIMPTFSLAFISPQNFSSSLCTYHHRCLDDEKMGIAAESLKFCPHVVSTISQICSASAASKRPSCQCMHAGTKLRTLQKAMIDGIRAIWDAGWVCYTNFMYTACTV